MAPLALKPIEPDHAARVMRGAGLVDPAGIATPETIAAKGHAFELTTAGGTGVFVVEKRGNQLWVHGAGATGATHLTADGLGVIEAIAKQAGCDRVAFQTARRGLVRLAAKQGYRVTGFILEKRP